jgi:hypothetical protein
MNTQGFYKYTNNELFYGPNFVINANYELIAENHEQYTYPVDGWSWFDSELEAKAFFNIPISEPSEPNPPFTLPNIN